MNTLRYSLLLLLGGLLPLVLDSCRSTSEAPQLVVNEGKASQPLVARSEGDTLRIPFTSSIYDHRLQITEAEDWIDTKLERGMLLIYVARNSSPTKRTAQLTLQIIERGERREAQHITVVQPASVSLASDRYLFAYTSALKVSEDYFYRNPGIVFTLPLPASASLFETKEAFRTNLDATRLTTQLEYGSESRDWIHDLKFTRQGDIWGLSFRLDAIPQSLEQRRVRLRLSDPEHPNLSVALDFLQIRRPISLVDPTKEIQSFGALPQQYRLELRTDIPLEKLHLTTYVRSVDVSDRADGSDDRQIRSPHWQYTINPKDYQMERPELQRHFRLVKTASGVAIVGQTSSNNNLLDISSPSLFDGQLAFLVTNDLHDQKLWSFVKLPPYKQELYLATSGMKKRETIKLPQEASDFSIKLRLNTSSDDIEWVRPTFITIPDKDWGASPAIPQGATLTYPDLLTINNIRVTANPLRSVRRFVLQAKISTYIQSEYTGRTPLLPVDFVCEQEPFTGSYIFSTNEETAIDFAGDTDDSYQQYIIATVALQTNLAPEQILLEKPNPRSGWVQASLAVDPETGYVSSIAFYADKNDTGRDRSALLRLVPPSGEGLSPITFTLRQSH